MECIFCSKEMKEYGNLAHPILSYKSLSPSEIKDRLCCDKCNETIVIPVRLKEMSRADAINIIQLNKITNLLSID